MVPSQPSFYSAVSRAWRSAIDAREVMAAIATARPQLLELMAPSLRPRSGAPGRGLGSSECSLEEGEEEVEKTGSKKKSFQGVSQIQHHTSSQLGVRP